MQHSVSVINQKQRVSALKINDINYMQVTPPLPKPADNQILHSKERVKLKTCFLSPSCYGQGEGRKRDKHSGMSWIEKYICFRECLPYLPTP